MGAMIVNINIAIANIIDVIFVVLVNVDINIHVIEVIFASVVICMTAVQDISFFHIGSIDQFRKLGILLVFILFHY
jgi:hypothetical protein